MQSSFNHLVKKYLLLPVTGCFLYFISPAQKGIRYYNNRNGEQVAAALKLQAELGNRKNPLNWRLGISGGAGGYLGHDWLYPSINADLMLYQGGIGSKKSFINPKVRVRMEFIISYTLTAGLVNRMKYGSSLSPAIRDYPLYYFNSFCTPPLQNPFNWSLSWGGNLVFFPEAKCKDWQFQQVGFLNVHADRVQFSYANDGPPFFQPFGDKYDRLHTGIGVLSLHGNNDWAINLIEIGFNKFTGYSKNAYELSNQAGLIYIYYKDPEQQLFNKSSICLNVANTAQGWGASFNWYNRAELDIQHKIHNYLFYPLHMVPHAEFKAYGGMFIYKAGKIGLK